MSLEGARELDYVRVFKSQGNELGFIHTISNLYLDTEAVEEVREAEWERQEADDTYLLLANTDKVQVPLPLPPEADEQSLLALVLSICLSHVSAGD